MLRNLKVLGILGCLFLRACQAGSPHDDIIPTNGTITSSIVNTASPSQTESSTPTTQPSSELIQPVTEGSAAVRFESWSPTSDWLAFWSSTEEDTAGNFYPFPPGTLNFLNVHTWQLCSEPRFIARDYNDKVAWQPNGQVLVLSGGAAMQGMPCNNDFIVAPDVPVVSKTLDPALSPKGNYRARTTILGITNNILNISTAIFSTTNNQVINTVNWRIDEGVGELGLGGEWVTDTQFLIYGTRDQGPLLISAGKNAVQVAPELFKTAFVPNTGASLYAIASVLPGSDTYHLTLYGVGIDAEFPSIMLYHSETGAIETVPFTHLWSPTFSQDGRWLLLDQRPDRNGYESNALAIRSIDPVNSEIRYIGEGKALWTADWTKVAFGLNGFVSVLTFPDGVQLGTWNVRQYNLYPSAWSPDGRFIAVQGYAEGWQQALFIINVEK
jgi:hypothetical protein